MFLKSVKVPRPERPSLTFDVNGQLCHPVAPSSSPHHQALTGFRESRVTRDATVCFLHISSMHPNHSSSCNFLLRGQGLLRVVFSFCRSFSLEIELLSSVKWGNTLYILGRSLYILGRGLYILERSLYILGQTLYILGLSVNQLDFSLMKRVLPQIKCCNHNALNQNYFEKQANEQSSCDIQRVSVSVKIRSLVLFFVVPRSREPV